MNPQLQDFLKTKGYTPPAQTVPQASDWYAKLKAPETTPSYGEQVKTQYQQGIQHGVEGIEEILHPRGTTANEGLGQGIEGAFKIMGGTATAAFAPAAPLFNAINTGIEKITTPIVENPEVQKFATKLPDLPYERLASFAGDVGMAAGAVTGLKGGVKVRDVIGKATEIPKITPEQSLAIKERVKQIQQKKDAEQQAKAHSAVDDEVRNIAAKYPTSVGAVLSKSENVMGNDPISVLTSYPGGKALPTMFKGKLQVKPQISFLKNQIGILSNIRDDIIGITEGNTPVRYFKQEVFDRIDRTRFSQQKAGDLKIEAAKIINKLRATYPNGIPGKEMELLKEEHTGKSKNYRDSMKSPFQVDTHSAIADVARSIVQGQHPAAPIGELDKLISSHFDAVKLLVKMENKAPHGGMFSRHFGTLGGEVIGLGVGMVAKHPFLGAMAGRVGAEAVFNLVNNHFISNPLKRTLIKNMKGVDPLVIKKTLDFLKSDEALAAREKGLQSNPTKTPSTPSANQGIPEGKQSTTYKGSISSNSESVKGNPEAGFIFNPFAKDMPVPSRAIKDMLETSKSPAELQFNVVEKLKSMGEQQAAKAINKLDVTAFGSKEEFAHAAEKVALLNVTKVFDIPTGKSPQYTKPTSAPEFSAYGATALQEGKIKTPPSFFSSEPLPTEHGVGTPIFRGENASNKGGVHWTFDKNEARMFAGKDGKVIESKLPAGAVKNDSPEIQTIIQNAAQRGLSTEEMYNQLAERGYKAILSSDPMTGKPTVIMPKSLSVEDMTEMAGGWQPGLREKFDKALLDKDAQSVREMLPKVPAEYKKRFAAEINNITSDLKDNPQAGFINPDAIFQGFEDLTTKLLNDLKGKSTISKQYLEDATNRPELKQPERDLFRHLLKDEKGTINVKDFANKVKTELLPLTREGAGSGISENGGFTPKYENITLPDELRGPVANYGEHIYRSPIKTSAGDVHFSGNVDDYFAHTRVEDLPDSLEAIKNGNEKFWNEAQLPEGYMAKQPETGGTRRVIELQSDLFQKGRLEGEAAKQSGWTNQQIESVLTPQEAEKLRAARSILRSGGSYNQPVAEKVVNELEDKAVKALQAPRTAELVKLEPYRNTWHERVIREEVKQAAKDGKTKLQFPTGETAMKIEGLGERNSWTINTLSDADYARMRFSEVLNANRQNPLTPEKLKVGTQIQQNNVQGGSWIITDVLGDGKFKAVPKRTYESYDKIAAEPEQIAQYMARDAETFDISGKVDKNNPIYKFYEKEVGRYLTNKYGAKRITDPQGVEWYEVPVIKKHLGPIEAFEVLAATGLGAAAIPSEAYANAPGTKLTDTSLTLFNPKVQKIITSGYQFTDQDEDTFGSTDYLLKHEGVKLEDLPPDIVLRYSINKTTPKNESTPWFMYDRTGKPASSTAAIKMPFENGLAKTTSLSEGKEMTGRQIARRFNDGGVQTYAVLDVPNLKYEDKQLYEVAPYHMLWLRTQDDPKVWGKSGKPDFSKITYDIPGTILTDKSGQIYKIKDGKPTPLSKEERTQHFKTLMDAYDTYRPKADQVQPSPLKLMAYPEEKQEQRQLTSPEFTPERQQTFMEFLQQMFSDRFSEFEKNLEFLHPKKEDKPAAMQDYSRIASQIEDYLKTPIT